MKTATVLTLSYNSPDLFMAIDSVLMQTYGRIQFLLIDDASKRFNKEEVIEYISFHNKGNVTAEVLVNKENKGIIQSANIALRYAEGDYIINLAGDDCFFDQNVVADIVAEFERTKAFVLTGYRSICDNTMREINVQKPSKRIVSMIKNLTPQELFEEMTGCNLILGCCTAYSRKCFEQYGFYDEKYRNLDDYTMNMKLLRQGVKIKFFDRTFVKYRSGGISAVANMKENYMQEAEQVFQTEIEPYSTNPKKARRKYNAWKRHVKTDRTYAANMIKYRENKIMRMIFKCDYYLLHPKVFFLVLEEKNNLKIKR